MDGEPALEFGRRRPSPPVEPQGPVKRSGHVALLLMGTLAVGGGAYALMPRENCGGAATGLTAPSVAQSNGGCGWRRFSSGSGSRGVGWSRYSFFGGDAFSSRGLWGIFSDPGTDRATRGGFGSFARAFTAHFSAGS